jgi:hypothetical protein
MWKLSSSLSVELTLCGKKKSSPDMPTVLVLALLCIRGVLHFNVLLLLL